MIRTKFSKKFFFWIDENPVRVEKTNRLRLSGWCVARKGGPLAKVRVGWRGKFYEAPLNGKRDADGRSGGVACEHCGFVLELPIRRRQTAIVFQAADAENIWHEVFSSTMRGRRIATERERDQWREANASGRYHFWFEHPKDWGKPVRVLHISGWCFDRAGEPIAGVRAKIGRRVFAGQYGRERSDVAALFKNLPQARASGFSIAVPAPVTPATITIELQGKSGYWLPFFHNKIPAASRTATPDELFAPPGAEFFAPASGDDCCFRFWLDRPADWAKKIRYLRVTGWCLAASGEPIDAIRASLRGKFFPARYGSIRPDVALTFQQHPGALRSGFSLDAVVPRGPVDFRLEARSSGGPWQIFFRQRINGPLFREEHDPAREKVGDYSFWIRKYDSLSRTDRRDIQQHIAQFQRRPLISVLLPVYNSNLKFLRRAIQSVRDQLYPNWELCLVDDVSTDGKVWPLLQQFARRDPRIKVARRDKNGHISAASNDALKLATGEYLALLDHDDELAATALYFVALEINRNPTVQLLYSDEDKLDRQGRRSDPYFKPDWSPDLLLGQNYVSHLSVFATDLVRRAGGFRVGFEGSQDHDLILRCSELIDPSSITHIPRILYHWRVDEGSTASFSDVKPYAQGAARRAVQEHLGRRNIAAEVEPGYASYLRVRYKLPAKPPLVTIIIPTRDQLPLLTKCLTNIWKKTDYPSYEIVVLDNNSAEKETHAYLDNLTSNGRITVESIIEEFNYSRLNNRGAMLARGELILLLNNDVEVINESWLSEMVGQLLRPEVGAVGARLWYPDKVMQHGGVVLGAGGIANHAHTGIRFEHGYFARAHLTQNFSAVTAACILIKKSLYLDLGGFDEINLPIAFNDVDFCLRLRKAGYLVVWTPHAELFHHESASRGFNDTAVKQVRFLSEVNYMEKQWGNLLQADPYYNVNLSLGEDLFTLAFPPRLDKPWLLDKQSR